VVGSRSVLRMCVVAGFVRLYTNRERRDTGKVVEGVGVRLIVVSRVGLQSERLPR
jgi:hypothetical protein